jgi:hypothetical protein
MRHLPSIEALSDVDDRRLLAELELCRLLELVERAKKLLVTIADGSPGEIVIPTGKSPAAP